MSPLSDRDAKFVNSLKNLQAPVLTAFVLVGYMIFASWTQWEEMSASSVMLVHHIILCFCLLIMIVAWLGTLFSARSAIRSLQGAGPIE